MTAAVLCSVAVRIRPDTSATIAQSTAARILNSPLSAPSRRPVLKLAVVRGGVYSADEATVAGRTDAIVADHYRPIQIETLRPAVLDRPVMRYVSFRKHNHIYWTRNRVRIPAGEMVLANGDARVRARCGNRLSETPQAPTLPITDYQPTDDDLESEAAIGTTDADASSEGDRVIVAIPPPSAALPAAVALPPDSVTLSSAGTSTASGPGAVPASPGFGVFGPGGGIAPPNNRPGQPGSPLSPPATTDVMPLPPVSPIVLPEPTTPPAILPPGSLIVYLPPVITRPTSPSGTAAGVGSAPSVPGAANGGGIATNRPGGGGAAGSVILRPEPAAPALPPGNLIPSPGDDGSGGSNGLLPNTPGHPSTHVPEPSTALGVGVALGLGVLLVRSTALTRPA